MHIYAFENFQVKNDKIEPMITISKKYLTLHL